MVNDTIINLIQIIENVFLIDLDLKNVVRS